MSIELRGKPIIEKYDIKIKEKLEELKSKGINPTLATIRLGEHSDDITYERNIIRTSSKLGLDIKNIVKDEDISTKELLEVLDELNKDESITGILILSLLANREDHEIIRQAIDVDKDIDCIHPINLEKIFRGEIDGFAPCAAKASLEILDHYNIDLEGKDVVIINRSMVIGKPLAMMMLAKDATVTICHTKTKGLKEYTKTADLVVTAIGEAKYFDKTYFKDESILIDIGIDFDENKKLSGDINYEDVYKNVKMITPVPGGIGGVTTRILLYQVVSKIYNREFK